MTLGNGYIESKGNSAGFEGGQQRERQGYVIARTCIRVHRKSGIPSIMDHCICKVVWNRSRGLFLSFLRVSERDGLPNEKLWQRLLVTGGSLRGSNSPGKH
jgi:hypothetical protein